MFHRESIPFKKSFIARFPLPGEQHHCGCDVDVNMAAQLTAYAICSIISYCSKENAMPLLQVRDIPADLYETLSKVAASENRSIAQETIVLLKKALHYQEERSARRKRILEEIKAQNFKNTDRFPSPADLIREEREK